MFHADTAPILSDAGSIGTMLLVRRLLQQFQRPGRCSNRRASSTFRLTHYLHRRRGRLRGDPEPR